MAFSVNGLQRIGGSTHGTSTTGAPTLWTYRTSDSHQTVDTAGYFDNGATTNTGARNLLSVGDFIFVHASADGTATFGLAVVNSNSAGIVDITNLSVIAFADTD